MTLPLPDPCKIAPDARWQRILRRRFDRAAMTYAGQAKLQQQSADALLAGSQPAGVVLDAGCGSGHLARALARRPGVSMVLALDLSAAMLGLPDWDDADDTRAGITRLVADAASLPLASASIDTLYSNFALHWCPQPQALLRELQRVMRPGGMAHVVIPVAGSLGNRTSAAGAGASLQPASVWREAALSAGWQLQDASESLLREHHVDADAWLQALRAMGVTARRDSGDGLAGRRRQQALRASLEASRTAEGIPLTYHLWQARLQAWPDRRES